MRAAFRGQPKMSKPERLAPAFLFRVRGMCLVQGDDDFKLHHYRNFA
jgi:hypothetical protein